MGVTEESSVGEQSIGGDEHSFLAAQGDDCAAGDDGAGEVANGVVFGLSTHLNIF